MVDTKAPMLAPHPHDLVDHVEAIFWDLRPRVLLADDFTDLLVLCLFEVEERLGRGPTRLVGFLLFEVLGYDFVSLHVAVVVLLHNTVALGVSRAFGTLR